MRTVPTGVFRVVAVCASVAAVTSACGSSPDTESFTPPPAEVSATAQCTLPDITQSLSDIGLASPVDSSVPRPGVGSVPDGFTTDTVLRCERSIGPAGNIAIDAVTLTGDTAAVTEAFRRPSEKSAGNTSISCAFGEQVPAGLWLVSADGSALRPQWPSTICGYQDEPLATLDALRETGRTTVTTLGAASTPGSCPESTGYVFNTTTDADAAGSQSNPDDRALMLPTSDVADLTVCRYANRVDDTTLIDARSLSQQVSRDIATEAFAAPSAEPCNVVASTVVAGRLVRPDGSGGGVFTAELDGCARFMVPGVIGYRTLPERVQALLRG
ncbi:hypothetical protein [Rhodococcoides fascians]|uniref:hypothetical protein n=1 Tax=Rhodococcoides fascians TaxID=1828 RepID=UPI0007AAC9F1|nr:hypothetical protein [Rhodococcus fascians]AMY56458.1 hypothetical protein A3L23_05160 [Rhodococcus fascians D188]